MDLRVWSGRLGLPLTLAVALRNRIAGTDASPFVRKSISIAEDLPLRGVIRVTAESMIVIRCDDYKSERVLENKQ